MVSSNWEGWIGFSLQPAGICNTTIGLVILSFIIISTASAIVVKTFCGVSIQKRKLLDNFETTLRQLWDKFETTFKQVWDKNRPSDPFRDNVGTPLGPHGENLMTTGGVYLCPLGSIWLFITRICNIAIAGMIFKNVKDYEGDCHITLGWQTENGLSFSNYSWIVG